MPYDRIVVSALTAGMLLAGCGKNDGAAAPDAAPSMPTADGGSDAERWAEVEATVAAVVEAHSLEGMGLAIYDADDNKVFEKMFGDFAPDRRVPIASGSKLVSGLVLFHLIDSGALTLDSTTGDVLGWTGAAKSKIKLRHLLSFTSGLASSQPCTRNPLTTLEACVAAISSTTLEAAPGTQFDYGPVHLAVAGHMAEVRTGKSWNELFTEVITSPLGLPPDLSYTTLPRSGTGSDNPLVAAGLTASMNEYQPILATAFHKGTFNGVTIAGPEIFDAQATEPFPSATMEYSPLQDMGLPFHYGLTAWLECPPPATDCSVLSSPGAWGFTPWFDRDAGYYAIIGTFIDSTGEDGIVDYAVQLAQDLKPEIERALAAP